MGNIQVIQNLSQLKSELLHLGDAESSFALVVLRGSLDAHKLVAVRQAERLCDFVVALCLDAASLKQTAILKQAGAHVIFKPEEVAAPAKVDVSVKSIDATALLQTILCVMPMVVTCAPSDIILHEALERLHKTFPDTFSLWIEETPEHLLNAEQKQVREILLAARELILSGEGRFEVVRAAVQTASNKKNVPLVSLQILSEDLQVSPDGALPRSGLIHAQFDNLFDTLKF